MIRPTVATWSYSDPAAQNSVTVYGSSFGPTPPSYRPTTWGTPHNVLRALYQGLKERVDGLEDRILAQLDRIEQKLDHKVDK